MIQCDIKTQHVIQNIGCAKCRRPMVYIQTERGTHVLQCHYCDDGTQEFENEEALARSVSNNENVLKRGFEADETDMHPWFSDGPILWMITQFVKRGEVYPDVSNTRFKENPDECGNLVVAADVRHVSQFTKS